MKISVTNKHIDDGIPCDRFQCPLALAIQEATGEYGWNVGMSNAYSPDVHRLRLPEKAIEFRKTFDCNGPVSPFEFDLDLV